MKYRHEFHAGNFADVHKHLVLVALLRALQRKDTGLLYIETHAGRGLYVGGHDGHLGQEIREGYTRVSRGTAALASEISDYLATERRALAGDGPGSAAGNPDTDAGLHGPPAYAGSPLLAAALLRTQDRAVCCELQASECRALARALQPWPRVQVRCVDGLATLRALLPPPERRALLLIDPPYEDTAELDGALAAIGAALARLPSAVIALWYPIKDDRQLSPWLRRVASALEALGVTALQSELWRHPRDSRVALNGSGMLIINAPWQLDEHMGRWLPELGTLLGVDAQGGTALRWLVRERAGNS